MKKMKLKTAYFVLAFLILASFPAMSVFASYGSEQKKTIYDDLKSAYDFLTGNRVQVLRSALDTKIDKTASVFENADVRFVTDQTLTFLKGATNVASFVGTLVAAGAGIYQAAIGQTSTALSITTVAGGALATAGPFVSYLLDGQLASKADHVVTTFAVGRQAYEDFKARQDAYDLLAKGLDDNAGAIDHILKTYGKTICATDSEGKPISVSILDLDQPNALAEVITVAAGMVSLSKTMSDQLDATKAHVDHYQQIIGDSLRFVEGQTNKQIEDEKAEWARISSDIDKAKTVYNDTVKTYLETLQNYLTQLSLNK